MKVVTHLADVEFHVGKIERTPHGLVVHGDPDKSLPTTVYVSPGDLMQMLKAAFATPSVILYLLLSPIHYLRNKGKEPVSPKMGAPKTQRKPWPK